MMTEGSTIDARVAVDHADRLFVGGQWVRPRQSRPGQDVRAAANGTTLATVAQGGAEDVDAAVASAEVAWRSWSTSSSTARAELLEALAEAIERHRETLAATISSEVGTPLRVSDAVQVGLPTRVLRGFAAALRGQEQERIAGSILHRHPVGVVGAITPWNYPLHQVVAKVGAAIAAGCAVVLKPSNVAPLSALVLAELLDELGVPSGLVNVIPGAGSAVGDAIASHPGVDVVSFTGSTQAGAHVAARAAAGLRRVSLELGGKSASLVLDGADLEAAVKATVRSAFLNSGQTCSALTRLLVPRARLSEVEAVAQREVSRMLVGDPLASTSWLGPLASEEQKASVERFVADADAAGIRRVAVAPMDPANDERGYYVQPVVYSDVPRDAAIAIDEVFGPVLSIIPHDGDGDAVEIANSSAYGLAGAVWAADDPTGLAVARRLRTGQVDVNGAPFNPEAPFGGFGSSGWGRELGAYGIEEFLEVTAIQVR